jgi:hypothetical protein
MQPAEKPAYDQPRPGDVVITTYNGRFFLRVMPHPNRISFAEYEKALRIARQWAEAARCGIWQTGGGDIYEPVLLLPSTADDRS